MQCNHRDSKVWMRMLAFFFFFESKAAQAGSLRWRACSGIHDNILVRLSCKGDGVPSKAQDGVNLLAN